MRKNKFFYETYWYCAIRKRNNLCLDTDNNEPFKILKCQKHHWVADPFLFSNDGINYYLFAELTNTKKSKSVIGAKKVFPEEEDDFSCALELDGHVSYPCIFKQGKDIYLIPESCFNKTIQIYKANNFPYSWERIAILSEGKSFVDSTHFSTGNKNHLFLYEISQGRKKMGTLYIADLDIDNGTISHMNIVYKYPEDIGRPGGGVFSVDNQLIRVVQPSNKYYGQKIELWNFSYVDGIYHEHFLRKIEIEDLKIASNKKFIGVHTYNCFGEFETIDLLYQKFSPFKILKYIFKKLKVFGYGLYDFDGRKIYDK